MKNLVIGLGNPGPRYVFTKHNVGFLALDRYKEKKEKFYDEFKGIDISVINGGDGTGNHPSQNLLDLMTIQQEFGKFEGLE